LKRPQGSKVAKEAKKMNKLKDYAARVHAITDVVATTLRKLAILEDHATMVLFTMLKDQLVMKEACE
jgi:hypothetical protein